MSGAHKNHFTNFSRSSVATWERRSALEIWPESQLAGFSAAPERRNTVVDDMFVHTTRCNHP